MAVPVGNAHFGFVLTSGQERPVIGGGEAAR